MKIKIAIKQTNLDKLESLFWDVSNPKSNQYQNFPSNEKIDNLIKPLKEHLDIINEWIKTFNSFDSDNNIASNDYLDLNLPISIIEKVFKTEIYQFEHGIKRKRINRHWGEYSIPTNVFKAIDMIEGLSDFPMYNNPKVNKATGDTQV